MVQLSRKVEPRHVIEALGVLSVSVEHIQNRGRILPTELCAMLALMEGLLEFRTLLNVQKSKQVAIEEVSDELFGLATEFINRARACLVLENVIGIELSELLISYSSAMNAALKTMLATDAAREQEFRVAMQWTK
jgi:hypothetical protein